MGHTIYREITALGHTHTLHDFADNTPEASFSLSREQRLRHFPQITTALSKAQIMVSEVTTYSITTGILVQKALEQKFRS